MEDAAMTKTRGTGLLMVWIDIDSEFEAEFNRWYDEEHIPLLLQVPGFLSAGRYSAVKGSPKYLAIYELEDHNVLRTAAYLDTVKYRPSAARQKYGTSGAGRNFLRNAYRQIFPLHTNPVEQTAAMAPALQMGRIDVPSAVEGGIQRLAQHGLHTGLSRGARLPRRPPLCRGRGPAEISDPLRIREPVRFRERGVEPGAVEQSVDPADVAEPAP
jgi:hypothetical protein